MTPGGPSKYGAGLHLAITRFAASQSGNIAIMAAAFLPVALVLAAFAVDQGALYLERRQAQGLTDLAALTAANNLDRAERAALQTFADNRIPAVAAANTRAASAGRTAQINVQLGNYRADPALTVDQRFRAGRMPYNAVQVIMRREGAVYLSRQLFGGANPILETRAVAEVEPVAAFSVGSRLLRLEDGVLNAVLGGLLGTELTLTVMDYEALIDTQVDLFGMLDALASELNLTAGTYNELLAAEASVAQIASVIAALDNTGAGGRHALLAIAGARGTDSLMVPLSRVVSAGSFGRLAIGEASSALKASVSALHIISAGAVLSDGERQAGVELAAQVPGVASLTAALSVGEPPQYATFAVGQSGETVRTAQTRLQLVAQIGGSGILSATSIRMPIYLEVAYAQARLEDIDCPGNGAARHVRIAARPGVVDAWVGEVDAYAMQRFDGRPGIGRAQMVRAGLIDVRGRAHADVGDSRETSLLFTQGEIANGIPKRVSTHDFAGSLVPALLGDLDLDVSGLSTVSLSGNAVGDAISGAVTPLAAQLDQVIFNVLALAGVSIGEADVWVDGARCDRAVLVQ